MIAKNLINQMIPPLKPSDPIDKAIAWMRELHMDELPVVEKGNFFGIFSEELMLNSGKGKSLISDFELSGSSSFIHAEEHYYELLKNANERNLNLVAIVDESKKYLGVVSIRNVMEAFSKMSAINSPGAIIVLSMPSINYSLAEISRIVESEAGKILSSFIETHPDDETKIRLTIKLHMENASNIVSALERFGYQVISKFGMINETEMEQERLDTLMKYLQI